MFRFRSFRIRRSEHFPTSPVTRAKPWGLHLLASASLRMLAMHLEIERPQAETISGFVDFQGAMQQRRVVVFWDTQLHAKVQHVLALRVRTAQARLASVMCKAN